PPDQITRLHKPPWCQLRGFSPSKQGPFQCGQSWAPSGCLQRVPVGWATAAGPVRDEALSRANVACLHNGERHGIATWPVRPERPDVRPGAASWQEVGQHGVLVEPTVAATSALSPRRLRRTMAASRRNRARLNSCSCLDKVVVASLQHSVLQHNLLVRVRGSSRLAFGDGVRCPDRFSPHDVVQVLLQW
ncbi:hypothetical protein IscW_ISCW002362, partial [Ixodes scapularis]